MKKLIRNVIFRPKAREELQALIQAEIKKNGNQCDLNHIDVSLVTDFYDLFESSEFNGDISGWDVSRVTNMHGMFYDSKFNGDISRWNVSNVIGMRFMFANSEFNGDISKWDVSRASYAGSMFRRSNFYGDISNWSPPSIENEEDMFLNSKIAKKLNIERPTLDEVKSHFIALRLEASFQERLPRQNSPPKVRL